MFGEHKDVVFGAMFFVVVYLAFQLVTTPVFETIGK